MSEYYDPDIDARPQSPPLFQKIRLRATPSQSPPPLVTPQPLRPITRDASSSSRRPRKRRQKIKPSQGDYVLIRAMDPNRPDIAKLVGEHALKSTSETESEDEDMEDRSVTAGTSPTDPQPSQNTGAVAAAAELQATAQKALETRKNPPLFHHRDSVVESDGHNHAATEPASTTRVTNGTTSSATVTDSKPPVAELLKAEATSPVLAASRHSSVANGISHEGPLSTAGTLSQLTIPRSQGSPSQTLPALQPQSALSDGAPASPNQERRLPSFRTISEIAESAILEQQQHQDRANSYVHRQSISSSTHSPTSNPRQLSISSALSPGSVYPPLSAQSPNGEIASRDPFLRSGQSHLTLFSNSSRRRPSQASDSSPYSATLPSASTTTDSYHSSDGVSPGTQPTPTESLGHRMSIDGTIANRPLLPPPNIPNGPHIQHIPPHGSTGFKCDHPGCTAAPFQTQYLLNSHANVHSQSRPHYCPVQGCPRAEGGRGFKRKNEMIRHGLVHASPGYICPFCPDREHKYPRPDNLQRHVRVHHADVNKDDPQLREVLAQRPEGGSRGRRRRVGS